MVKKRKPQKTSNDYWAGRLEAERQWIKNNIANDDLFNRRLQRYYDQVIANINQLIDTEYARFGDKDLARQKVNQMDVQAYSSKAKQIVEEAQVRIRAGDKPTYADYSREINARLRLYNATMRINRLEYIKSQIGLEMVRSGLKVDADLRDKLSDDYMQGLARQAGILSDSAENSPLWTNISVAKQVLAQNAGATFSKRLWANQDVLKAKLDQVMASGVITGQNPREVARHLRDQVKTSVDNQRYVTERLARTESARIQNHAQLESIKGNGYKYVMWIAEPKACPECSRIAKADNGWGAGVYEIDKVPLIPEDTHPNCRCSISTWWVDDDTISTHRKYLSANPKIIKVSHGGLPIRSIAFYVLAKLVGDDITQYRMYDSEGNASTDIDLTDHGNPKRHPIVPHAHQYEYEDGIITDRTVGRELNDVEREYLKKWGEDNEDTND